MEIPAKKPFSMAALLRCLYTCTVCFFLIANIAYAEKSGMKNAEVECVKVKERTVEFDMEKAPNDFDDFTQDPNSTTCFKYLEDKKKPPSNEVEKSDNGDSAPSTSNLSDISMAKDSTASQEADALAAERGTSTSSDADVFLVTLFRKQDAIRIVIFLLKENEDQKHIAIYHRHFEYDFDEGKSKDKNEELHPTVVKSNGQYFLLSYYDQEDKHHAIIWEAECQGGTAETSPVEASSSPAGGQYKFIERVSCTTDLTCYTRKSAFHKRTAFLSGDYAAFMRKDGSILACYIKDGQWISLNKPAWIPKDKPLFFTGLLLDNFNKSTLLLAYADECGLISYPLKNGDNVSPVEPDKPIKLDKEYEMFSLFKIFYKLSSDVVDRFRHQVLCHYSAAESDAHMRNKRKIYPICSVTAQGNIKKKEKTKMTVSKGATFLDQYSDGKNTCIAVLSRYDLHIYNPLKRSCFFHKAGHEVCKVAVDITRSGEIKIFNYQGGLKVLVIGSNACEVITVPMTLFDTIE